MSSACSGSPICLRIFSICSMTTGFSLWPWSSVSTKPGSMIVTRMPECRTSWRSASEKPPTPHFVEVVDARCPSAGDAPRDRRQVHDVAAALLGHHRQRRVRAVQEAEHVDVDHPLPVARCRRPVTGPSSITPALLTRMSTPAELLARALDERARAAPRRVTSTSIAAARPPSDSIRSRSDSSRSARRAPSATAAPSRASATAVASPMPDDAPVTSATLPSSAAQPSAPPCVGRALRQLDQHPRAEPGRAVARCTDAPCSTPCPRCRRAPTACRRRTGAGTRPRRTTSPCAARTRSTGRRTGPSSARSTRGAAAAASRSRRSPSPAASTSRVPVVVVREQPGVGRPERDDDRAGQRGQVDDPLGALVDRVDRARRPGSAGPRRRCC